MRKLLLVLSVFICSQAMAQLVLSPLNYNPRLYYSTGGSHHGQPAHTYKSFTIIENDTLLIESDTLSLPFIDDFTHPSLRPYFYTGIYDTLHNVIGPCDTSSAWTIATVTDTFSFSPTYTYTYDTATKSIDSVRNDSILFLNTYASNCFYSGNTAYLFPRGYIDVFDTITGAMTYQIFDTTDVLVPLTYAPVLYKCKAAPNTKWLDNNAYQNYTSAYLPPTLGVVTFDGLNSQGQPYNNSSPSNWGLADILTSKPINLGGLSPTDSSVYISFFYQRGGFGYDAVVGDSLVLQFHNAYTNQWDDIPLGSITGDSVPTIPPASPDPFKQVIIRIPITTQGPPVKYLDSAFQFRFLNYGPLTGGVDIWNLDYVRLDKGRSITDTSISDVAFQYQFPSILKNYSEMPIEQFAGKADLIDTVALYVDYLNPSVAVSNPPATQYTPVANETFPSASVVMAPPTSLPFFNAGPENILYLFPDTQYTSPATGTDTMMIINSTVYFDDSDILPANDTISHDQLFYNTLAYDDGSAEMAIGVTNLFSPTNKFAYDFTLNQPDSLIAFQVMYGNVNINVSQLVFDFNLWYNLDTNNVYYQDTPVYTTSNLVPYYMDSVNGYTTYRIPAVYLPTHFYFGWSQADVNNLQVGYDVNSTKGYQHIYFYANGVWENASIDAPLSPPGSPMIRLLLGHSYQITSGIKDIKQNPVKVYPNPTTGIVTFDLPDGSDTYNVQLYSMVGQLSFGETINSTNNTINISTLDAGLYLIRLTDNTTGIVYQNKIVKSGK